VPLCQVRIGAAEHGQDVGTPGEGAPGLGTVDAIPLDPVDGRGLGSAFDAGAVATDVGLGHGDPDHELATGHAGEPGLLLLVGSTGHERLRQDLRSRDERAGRCERRPRKLLGGDDHGQVAHAAPAVLLGNGQPEVAELRHLFDEFVGNELVVAMDPLGVGCDLGIRELAHRIPRQLLELVEGTVVAAPGVGDLATDRTDAVLADGFANEL
jgi:hypothetical protein